MLSLLGAFELRNIAAGSKSAVGSGDQGSALRAWIALSRRDPECMAELAEAI